MQNFYKLKELNRQFSNQVNFMMKSALQTEKVERDAVKIAKSYEEAKAQSNFSKHKMMIVITI